jgi:hypothetical protein
VAADVGLKLRVVDHLALHGAVGTSLRSDSLGGPQLRVYVGLKGEIAVF